MFLLLFDIDGTLLDTRGAGRRAMERVAREMYGEAFSFDRVTFGGNLDPLIFREAAGHHGVADIDTAHDAFHPAYLEALDEELRDSNGDILALPGVHDALAHCRGLAEQRRVTLGCLTGNYTGAAPLKLRHVGIDPEQFTVTAFGDEAPDRPGLVPVAMRKHGESIGESVDPRRVVVIGDTPRDVDCAQKHGCVSYAVCTGAADRDTLAACGPDVLVEDLTDLSPLLALLDA